MHHYVWRILGENYSTADAELVLLRRSHRWSKLDLLGLIPYCDFLSGGTGSWGPLRLRAHLQSSYRSGVCSCYYQLRQLRVIARTLNFNAAVSIVHAFVFSRLGYCSSIFAGLLGVRMENLRRVHRAEARLIGGFKKFDHISQYMRDVLHWLPFPQRISYRIASLVWRCLSGGRPPICASCSALSLWMCRPSYTSVLFSR